jgi:hypothetical protein
MEKEQTGRQPLTFLDKGSFRSYESLQVPLKEISLYQKKIHLTVSAFCSILFPVRFALDRPQFRVS